MTALAAKDALALELEPAEAGFEMQALPPPDPVWLNVRRLVYQALVDHVA